jgi:hypothetical protein
VKCLAIAGHAGGILVYIFDETQVGHRDSLLWQWPLGSAIPAM